MFLFCLVFAMFCARLFICASWSPAGKGLTSWLSFVVSSVSLSLSHWYPGSGVVLDCIDSWSLQPYLLCDPAPLLYLIWQCNMFKQRKQLYGHMRTTACSVFCCALFCVLSSFAIILMWKRELVALLCMSSWCLGAVIVLWFFLTVSLVGMQCVVVVFHYHTHFLFRLMH